MAYIQSWIPRFEEDNRLIVQAAANAQKAIDLIVGTTFEEEITQETGGIYCANLPARVGCIEPVRSRWLTKIPSPTKTASPKNLRSDRSKCRNL